MCADHDVHFTRGSPETILPELSPETAGALALAIAEPPERRAAAVAGVAASWPRCLDAWAELRVSVTLGIVVKR